LRHSRIVASLAPIGRTLELIPNRLPRVARSSCSGGPRPAGTAGNRFAACLG
jgi:hypothetical protein